ncbi:hypothetical protein CGMCC3_g6739 [Colletotrichum fructicola]|nr:uncharacterized protein CGMCC3_g6739 [Colletotrichum fructicola]KAE9577062.1 hypothetical protein CGMCC3_g6739 [Colletotrichum fructicola]
MIRHLRIGTPATDTDPADGLCFKQEYRSLYRLRWAYGQRRGREQLQVH